MTVPLWILAFFAAVAGVMAISGSRFSLANWVDPVFGSNLFHDNLSTAGVGPRLIDAVVAIVFVLIGLRLWSTRVDRPALEAAFLRGAWYINELYDTVFGRPSERLAAFSPDLVDPKSSTAPSTAWPVPSAARVRCSGAPRPGSSATTSSGSCSGPS